MCGATSAACLFASMQLKGAAFPYRRDPVLLAENSLHGRLPVLYWQETSPPAVSNMTEAGETTLEPKTALSVRNLSVFSFWTQLSLSVVSGIILFFSVQSGTVPGQAPNVSVYFTLVGTLAGFLSTFLAHSFRRTARAVLEKGDAVATGKVVSGLLRNMTVNLWGLGATVIGLQATVGTLVAKTLTSTSQNPYQMGRAVASGAPAALDAFSIQASTNTVAAHFASIVFVTWMLRLINQAAAKQQAAPA
mmetsp:Transcript_19621/g.59348  ORF Transcript_19621/g.59348 Transcript_19621/m.59348 type:complete len:248 (-) Transcript_19621:2852-3595(-)